MFSTKLDVYISEEPALLIFYAVDPDKEIVVCADGSPLSVGARLSHVVDGVERPVLFASSTLSPAERYYSQLHREALAIIFAVTRFHKYVYGKSFTFCSDSEALKEIFNPTKGTSVVSASRLQRWSVTLSMYKFIHRPAREMRHVDALSRLPLPDPTGIYDESIHRLSENCPLDFEKIRDAQKRDQLVQKLVACVHDGWPKKVPDFCKFITRSVTTLALKMMLCSTLIGLLFQKASKVVF